MISPTELEDYTGRLLDVASFRDYCPNGLQVEGARPIRTLASGVSASLEFLQAAIENGADAVLVHHGYFWKNEDARIVGIKKQRLALLLQNEVSLFAYHLPLDAHPELGNNARLGKILGLVESGRFGEQKIAMIGSTDQPLSLSQLLARIETGLGRAPFHVGELEKPVNRVAWCSGAAQDQLLQAAQLGADAFITGEVSERTVFEAREANIAFIAAGHTATERCGVAALGEHLAKRFGIGHLEINIDNPI